MVAINHLFPPDKINTLATWRFILYFKAPAERVEQMAAAAAGLKALQLKAVTFPFGFTAEDYDAKNNVARVAIEVSEERRRQPSALTDYEADFWKICAAMMGCGFGDLYYEAVDWRE